MKNIFGFTLLRNGIKYDYPFLESLRGLNDLCSEVYVALGNSDDGTERALADLPNLQLIPTVWDEGLRKSGLILSIQTNIALEALRAKQSQGWAVYLQADEVLDAATFPQLRADLARAEEQGCDALSFRYLHFWKHYDQLAISPRWYPQEVRAIRLESAAKSYGDAQSFQPLTRVYESEVPVFHYGHVRRADAYERKKWDFGKWWHNDQELKKVLARGDKREKQERLLRYLGPHPEYMRAKIQAAPPARERTILVYGCKELYSASFLERVQAQIHWTLDPRAAIKAGPESAVLLEPLPWLNRLRSCGRHHSAVPEGMESERARPWNREFQAILKFSEKGISVS